MRRLLVLVLVLASSPAVAGEHDAAFAKGFNVAATAVHDLVGYELPAGNELTHVLVGRFAHGEYVMTGALLMKCNASECTWRRAEFGAADAIEVHGVVDLHGAPAAIPNRAITPGTGRYAKVPGARDMKFPVLVVRTRESKVATSTTRPRQVQVEAKETRVKLYLVSLVDEDRGSVVLQDTADQRSASGRGFTRSYRLDKGDAKVGLDVVVKEQHHLDRDSRCLRPDPTEASFALDARHYRPKKFARSDGC